MNDESHCHMLSNVHVKQGFCGKTDRWMNNIYIITLPSIMKKQDVDEYFTRLWLHVNVITVGSAAFRLKFPSLIFIRDSSENTSLRNRPAVNSELLQHRQRGNAFVIEIFVGDFSREDKQFKWRKESRGTQFKWPLLRPLHQENWGEIGIQHALHCCPFQIHGFKVNKHWEWWNISSCLD